MVLKCSVKKCLRNSSSDLQHSFFRLPKDAETRHKWLNFLGMDDNCSHARVCTDHFETRCIRKKYPRPLLVKNAVPTVRKSLKQNPQKKEVYEQRFANNEHNEAQLPKEFKVDSSPARTQILNINANNVSQIIISGENRNIIVNIMNTSKNQKAPHENVRIKS